MTNLYINIITLTFSIGWSISAFRPCFPRILLIQDLNCSPLNAQGLLLEPDKQANFDQYMDS